MARTQEELNQIKEEFNALNNKLKGLTEDELSQVVGGEHGGILVGSETMVHAPTFGESVAEGEINPSSTKGWFGTNG